MHENPLLGMTADFPALQKRIHAGNHRWWHDEAGNRLDRNKGELISLIHSEIAEGTLGIEDGLMDDHLPKRPMVEVEMADASIRILDYAEGFSYDIYGAALQVSYAVSIGWTDLIRPVDAVETVNHARIHVAIKDVTEGERKNAFHEVITDRKAAEVGLAVAMILIRNYCDFFSYDLIGAIEEKLAYNAQRADHTYAARNQANGKKW